MLVTSLRLSDCNHLSTPSLKILGLIETDKFCFL